MKLGNWERMVFAPDNGGEGGGGGGEVQGNYAALLSGEDEGIDDAGEETEEVEEGDEAQEEESDNADEQDEDEQEDDEETEEEESGEEEDDKKAKGSKFEKMLKDLEKANASGLKENPKAIKAINDMLGVGADGKRFKIESVQELKEIIEDGKEVRARDKEIARREQDFLNQTRAAVKRIKEEREAMKADSEQISTMKKEHWLADQAMIQLASYDPEAHESLMKCIKHVAPHYKGDQKKDGPMTKEDIRKAMREERAAEQEAGAKKEWARGWDSIQDKVAKMKRLGIPVSEKMVKKAWAMGEEDGISVADALEGVYGKELARAYASIAKKNGFAAKQARKQLRQNGGPSTRVAPRGIKAGDYEKILRGM